MTAGLTEGRAMRDAGIEQANLAATPAVSAAIDDAIEALIDAGTPFSANDLRPRFPAAGPGLIGARMRSYATRRVDGRPLMVPVGRTPSNLPSTHAHEIRVWLGADAHALLHSTHLTGAS